MSAFCAICTDDRGPFVQRPLGRGDAMVSVCSACDDEPAKTKRGPEIAYEVPERMVIGQTLKAFASAANRVTGDTAQTNRARRRGASLAATLSPGFVLERVRRYGPAGTIDAKEARATLRHEPWFAEVRHLGSDRRWHLFERPDVDAARAARSGSDRDPLAEIRSHATND